ncbi:hypothetical protein GR183_21415 [Stappia sp. GBMRC 2046]|uniref:Outer membrane protein beta-barrel domain-containing protein n=1 Tax=Stappia sediminis TaxID=2692190 RepID=A0A7X3LYE5_9HYPH|nr:hypothetical protein [Stappia sediminis]MXN67474.1 hypothetical protein [Stappia sediminis]
MYRLLYIFLIFVLSTTISSASDYKYRAEIMAGVASGHDKSTEPNTYVLEPDFTIHPLSTGHTLDIPNDFTYGAAIWWDIDWLSYGLEYTAVNGKDRYGQNDRFFNRDAASGSVKYEVSSHAFLLNLAARGTLFQRLHPYAGAGIGPAIIRHSFEYTPDYQSLWVLPFSFNIQTRAKSKTSVELAYQVFGGMDFDVTERVYVGGRISWFGTNETSFVADSVFSKRYGSANAKIGVARATVNVGMRF